MRILMLNYEFPPLGGGAGNANYYLLKEFSKKDIHIDLVTSSDGKFKVEKFSDNITIHKLDVGKKNIHYWTMKEMLRWTMKAYRYSKKLVKKKEYDLVHCWFGWPSGWIGYKLKLPYIVALRGSDVPGYNNRLKFLDSLLFKPISKKVWKKARKVIANSSGLKDLALKTYNRDIDIIYNGVDVDYFKPSKKNNKKIRLISTGRLIERKGYGYLIDALGEEELVLIGEGNLVGELKEKAKGKDVKFLGRLEKRELVKELQKSDVFVLPSLNEGMSNSVLEAMACGLPLIVTDVGGSKELVDGNGFIIEKGSVESIKNVLNKINRKDLVKMGKKSREIAEGMSWKEVGKEYEGVYENNKAY